MNIFAGNILVAWDSVIELDEFDYIESFSNSWDKSVYIVGETELKSSQELREMLESRVWKISHFDMSMSSELAVWVTPYDYEAGVYECSSFEWESVGFEEITERFEDVEWVFAIREAGVSEFFWNKIVKVDFIY